MLATSLLREQRSNCTRVDRDFRAAYVTRTPPARFTNIRTINLGYGSEMGTESKERRGNSIGADAVGLDWWKPRVQSFEIPHGLVDFAGQSRR